MNLNITWLGMAFLISSFAGGCASAQETSQPPAGGATVTKTLSTDSSVDQILDALDRRGQNLQTLTSDVKLIETDAALGDSWSRGGKFWLETRPDGSPRAHVLFNRK